MRTKKGKQDQVVHPQENIERTNTLWEYKEWTTREQREINERSKDVSRFRQTLVQ